MFSIKNTRMLHGLNGITLFRLRDDNISKTKIYVNGVYW